MRSFSENNLTDLSNILRVRQTVSIKNENVITQLLWSMKDYRVPLRALHMKHGHMHRHMTHETFLWFTTDTALLSNAVFHEHSNNKRQQSTDRMSRCRDVLEFMWVRHFAKSGHSTMRQVYLVQNPSSKQPKHNICKICHPCIASCPVSSNGRVSAKFIFVCTICGFRILLPALYGKSNMFITTI